jgi:hypothetical protein
MFTRPARRSREGSSGATWPPKLWPTTNSGNSGAPSASDVSQQGVVILVQPVTEIGLDAGGAAGLNEAPIPR